MATTTDNNVNRDAGLNLGLHPAMEVSLVVPEEARTLCGLAVLVPKEGDRPAKKCAFGGLIMIDSKYYGLVARHPFQESGDVGSPSNDGGNGGDGDGDSGYNGSGDENEPPGLDLEGGEQAEQALHQPGVDVPESSIEVEEPVDADLSQAPPTNCTSWKVQVLVPSTVDATEAATKDFDWALLDLSQVLDLDIKWPFLLNRVQNHVIRRIDSRTGDYEGRVDVVCANNRFIPAYLTQWRASLNIQGSSYDVRPIQLGRPLCELNSQLLPTWLIFCKLPTWLAHG